MEDKGLIGGSEAVLNLPPNSSIPICYHSLFGPHDDLLLLELDDKLLTELLHHRVTMRGQPNEEAVLCTPSTTYAIKFVSTSNSVFLIPPSDLSSAENRVDDRSTVGSAASVIKVSPGTMELVQVAPRLDKLRSLLSQKPFRLDDENEGSGDRTGLYRWIDLVDRIQSSDGELRAGLRALSAVEIDGYWRIVDEKSMDEILSIALHNSVLYGWSLNALKEDEVLSAMVKDGFSQTIALHCLETYGNKAEGVGEYNVWSFNERRVCVHFARQILSRGKRKMEIFMDEWIRSIPTGFCASLDMLEGEMLVERIGVEMWVHAFSVYSLPSDPAERFSVLFRERQKWEWKDLQPYIRDLRVPGLSSEGLLIKYTRRTQPTADAEPVFSAR